MTNYSKTINQAKGIAAALWGAISAAIAVLVGNIEVIEAGALETPALDETVTVLVVTIGSYLFARFNNWRKHSNSAPYWLRDLNLVPILKALFPLILMASLVALPLVGCSTTKTTLPDGTAIEDQRPDTASLELLRETLPILRELYAESLKARTADKEAQRAQAERIREQYYRIIEELAENGIVIHTPIEPPTPTLFPESRDT